MSDNYTILIREVGRKLIEDFSNKGHVACGVNGPYDDKETEIRYLSHLAIIASVECLFLANIQYRDTVNDIGRRILSLRGVDGTYKMRDGADECNGVIGNAWLLEGLLYAYRATGNETFLNESERIIQQHQFNKKMGLWERPIIGGVDMTFNHQLWFAASLAEFLQLRFNEPFQLQLDSFFDSILCNYRINGQGRITHVIFNSESLRGKIKQKLSRTRCILEEKINCPSMKYKEEGYHLFNLMAFARIYLIKPNWCFFQSNSFFKALDYLNNRNYLTQLCCYDIKKDRTLKRNTLTAEEASLNIYGFPYNVPGFEIKYCQAVFCDFIDGDIAEKVLEMQFETTWDGTLNMFGKKCHDRVAINYRVYEYYRYLEFLNIV